MFGRQDAGEVACTERESRWLPACTSVHLMRQRERLRAAQRIDFTGFASGSYDLGSSVPSSDKFPKALMVDATFILGRPRRQRACL